jgi:histidinol-phosphate/aromatic aminotransferase/cobyric acid decarboxylase-like protein
LRDIIQQLTSQILRQKYENNAELPNKNAKYRISCGIFAYKSSIVLLWTQKKGSLRVTIGTKTENSELIAALRQY